MTRVVRRKEGTSRTSSHLSDLCGAVLGSLDERVKAAPWKVAEGWSEVVGEQVAGMTRVVGFEKGILTVCVSNSTLLSLLARQEKGRLMVELKKRAPGVTIKDILFRLGEI
ncbi:MAG: DUF721 domain-containing protein [Simkaniaceae bacterium]|nr:DUF721 domain-containing protein [Simkaniaceae bacterium]